MLIDAVALAESLPFIGEEKLLLSIRMPNGDNTSTIPSREMLCHIFKVEGREDKNSKTGVYTLHFASIESFTDMNSKISMTYKGKISDTIPKLVNGQPGWLTSKPCFAEPTSNDWTHTSNYWNPTQNIYFLASRAVNKKNNQNYTFFENAEGFFFASIETMYEQEPLMFFVKDEKMRGTGKDPQAGDRSDGLTDYAQSIIEQQTAILDMSIPVHLDYIDRVNNGFYGSTTFHADIYSKRLNQYNFLAAQDLKNKTLNKQRAFNDNLSETLQVNPEAHRLLTVVQREVYPGMPILQVDHNNRRLSLLKQSTAMTINIRVYGRLDYSVGRVVELLIYSQRETLEKDTDEQIIDEYLSGKYLITAISHEINRNGYFCNIELAQDSFNKKL